MKSLHHFDIIEYARQQEVKGNGTEFKPFIFEEFDFRDEYSESIEIIKSDLHIKFVGIIFHQEQGRMVLKKSKNISFENCKLHSLEMKKCSDIKVKNCEFDSIHLYSCRDSNFNKCTSQFVYLYICFGNTFKDCIFKQAINSHSRGNVFERGQITPNNYEKFFAGYVQKGKLYWIYWIVGVTVVIISSLPSFYRSVIMSNPLDLFLPGLLILALTIFGIYAIFTIIRDKLASRKYLPNLIIP